MTNVPTDRTENPVELESVEQPQETLAPEVAQAETNVEQPQETETPVEVVENEKVAEEETVAVASESSDEDELEMNLETMEELEEESKTYVIPETKEEIVERVRTLSEHAEQSEKQELDLLKQAFYKILKDERTQNYNAFIAGGGVAEEYKVPVEPLEETFKQLMSVVKEHRAKILEAVEHQKEINLTKKKNIIDQIKVLANSPEDANKNYDTFRKLQDEWKDIKPIPLQAANEVWKNFQFVVEQYYDLLKENSALRDYDFKKNLEAKTHLCEEAEKLADEEDIIRASHQLQQLHQEYREIGPVAKDLREELWTRFKAASSVVNKRHAQYFEALKAKEEENLAKKTTLCEEIENIETANLQTYAEWENITKRIIEIQQEWKEVGRATKKMNTKIFERFRAACDNFFSKKSDHFKAQKKIFAENTAKKMELIEKAESLKESTEWASVTNKLVELQKAWKQIGPVPHKSSNSLWERFNNACNYFFEQKKQVLGDQRKEELGNLTAKRTIIEKLEAVAIEGGEDAAEKVKALMEEWNATGHVPFKEKDKIYAKYREIVNRLYKELNIGSAGRARSGRKGGERNERRGEQNNRQTNANSLYRQYETKKAELATYENNITFLTAHSKNGNALIDSMNRKIETLKSELISLVERIKAQEAEAASAETAGAPAENVAENVAEAAQNTAEAAE